MQNSKGNHDKTNSTLIETARTKEECKPTRSSCQDSLEGNAAPRRKHGTGSPSIEGSKNVADQEHIRRDAQKGYKKKTSSSKYSSVDGSLSRKDQESRYENSFNGYCLSCYEFGHKAMKCKNCHQKSLGSVIAEMAH